MSAAKHTPGPSEMWRDIFEPGWREREEAHWGKLFAVIPVVESARKLFSGRYFLVLRLPPCNSSTKRASRSANSRELQRFGTLHCAQMQREAAELYAAARDAAECAAIAKATGSAA